MTFQHLVRTDTANNERSIGAAIFFIVSASFLFRGYATAASSNFGRQFLYRIEPSGFDPGFIAGPLTPPPRAQAMLQHTLNRAV
jgi:hypothetical protein